MTKRDESRLREPGRIGLRDDEDSAEFLTSLLAAVPAYIVRLSPDFRIRYINRADGDVDPAELVGVDPLQFIDDAYRASGLACLKEVQRTGTPRSFETESTGPDGTRGYFRSHISAIRESSGQVGLCVVAVDVTEQRRIRMRAEEADARLKMAIDATGLGLWSWDIGTDELTWTERMREIHGVDETPTVAEYGRTMIHPEDRAAVRERTAEIFETGDYKESTHRIVQPGGDVRWVFTNGQAEYGDDGTLVRLLGGTLDVTDQRLMEEQLRRSHKMEAIGSVTAGVAHNFNNMLMVLLPSFDLLADVIPASHKKIADDALDVGERAATMVKQLMGFAGHRLASIRVPIPLSDVIESSCEICRGALGSMIELNLELPKEDPVVIANAEEVRQTVVSMVLNARDALMDDPPAAPVIDVRADVVPAEDCAFEAPFGALEITITDNGPGMTDAVKSQLFVPFFTTRRPLNTGLGLATAYAIVREHGGRLRCESRPGAGATFTIVLPIAQG